MHMIAVVALRGGSSQSSSAPCAAASIYSTPEQLDLFDQQTGGNKGSSLSSKAASRKSLHSVNIRLFLSSSSSANASKSTLATKQQNPTTLWTASRDGYSPN